MTETTKNLLPVSEAAMRQIFLDGHSDGWTGNQMRRDVQHVDADKSWQLYVENGALAKTLASLQSPPAAEQDGAGMREGLERARGIVEADLHDAIDHCDADWEGMSRTALEAIDAALSGSIDRKGNGEPMPSDPDEAMGWKANRSGVSRGECRFSGERRERWERGHAARSAWVKAGRPASVKERE